MQTHGTLLIHALRSLYLGKGKISLFDFAVLNRVNTSLVFNIFAQ